MEHGADQVEKQPEAPPLGRPGAALLLATVFASGAAVMIVEMTAVRTVQPFFGSTTYVWTNVIAVVLAALALGYAVGGRLADRRPSPRLLYVLLGAGGILVALGALLVTPIARFFLQDGVDLEGVVSVLIWGSLGTSLVLFAPPILLLGTIAPIAIRLLSRRGVGRAAGSVFALSTTGSIVGTYLPTLVLVPYLGSRGSILVASSILLAASAVGLLASARGRTKVGAYVLLLCAAAAATAAVTRSIRPERPAPHLEGGSSTVLCETESPYQYLTVRNDVWPAGAERVLTINEGLYTYHAFQVQDRVLTGSRFYDAYSVLPLLLDLAPGSSLRGCVVGMACGVNAAQWHHFYGDLYDLHVDGAELDPAVIRLGRRYFDMPDDSAPWLHVHAMDGRSLLEHAPQEARYHIIVVDAFANELYVPFHLATHEFFELCNRRLESGGILAMNVYARGEEASNLASIQATMGAVFSHVRRVRHYDTGGFLLLARRGRAPVDPSRLAPGAVRRRLGEWDGFEGWTEVEEWEDLMALAEELRSSIATSTPSRTPGPQALLLTDDHAPLEWLTDRFLRTSETRLLEAGGARGAALTALRGKQTTAILLVALAWAVALLGLGLLLRDPRPPTGPEQEPATP